jgi:glutamate/tyrosine decarboxylase-like PLP-dependent enzyme
MRENQRTNLGWLTTPVNPVAVWAYQYFLEKNPNHLGNWSTKDSKPFGTQKLERSVIHTMVDLYHGGKKHLEGYITNGGTEGNLYSMWVGKKYLLRHLKKEKLCLLCTDLSHYSIRKNADIMGMDQYITPLHQTAWNMDIQGLYQTIKMLHKKGYRGFCIPLTLGYTQTGTSDDISSITLVIQKLKTQYHDIHFFLWIDAALSGLILPFIQDFQPFSNPLIQTIVVDYHKLGGVPYPAGIVLYRSHLRHAIQQTIPYLPELDTTLLGSRSGAPAAAIWTTIHTLGKQKMTALIQKQFTVKNYFMNQIRLICPDITLITDTLSLTCAFILPKKTEQSLQYIFLENLDSIVPPFSIRLRIKK